MTNIRPQIELIRSVDLFISPFLCISDIVRQGQEYLEVAETEKTKRDEIEAWRQTTLADINLKRELVIRYLDRSFDERAENFKSLFQTVDRAISTEDNYQLSLTLDAIVQLANSSPFQDLSDLSKVKAALNNPNHVWEL
jgi:hypothetical protein